MAPIALECPNAGCTLGKDGDKYKTPELEAELAVKIVDLHVQQNHAKGEVSFDKRNMRERQKKPSANMEMTEAKWRDFLNQWARYKRSSGINGQDIVDDLG